jgi:hypothetical protein
MEAGDPAEMLAVNAFQTLRYYGGPMLSETPPLSKRACVYVYVYVCTCARYTFIGFSFV